MSATNGAIKGTFTVKAGMAKQLVGGVIMDVVTPEQARIAEEAGAVAVMVIRCACARMPFRRHITGMNLSLGVRAHSGGHSVRRKLTSRAGLPPAVRR